MTSQAESVPQITAQMTMEEILQRIPSAQRALFQRYHVGGCSSCAFEPTDSLEKVCKDHNLLDVNEVLTHLQRAGEVDAKMSLQPTEVKAWLDAGEPFQFLDVRGPREIEQAALSHTTPLDYSKSKQYLEEPKDSRFVFICKDGARALDVAAYFAGHGFEAAYSVKGGLDAWREQVDPSLPEFEAEQPLG